MTVTVSAPNGSTVQFPDGTDHDTINRVMTQNFHPDDSVRAAASPAAQMPTFEIVGPDGTYHLNAPDERAAVAAWQAFQNRSTDASAPTTQKRTFTAQAPNGKNYTIEGDNAEGAIAALKKHLGDDRASTPQGSSLGGVAKSLGTGLAQGVIGLAGLPGDVGQLASNIGNRFGGDKVTGNRNTEAPTSPGPIWEADSLSDWFKKSWNHEKEWGKREAKSGVGHGDLPGSYIPPTSNQLQKSVEGVTGEFYKPQGAVEDIANKIGQFAPAMIGGPESLATKALTRVAAPAVASEAAGKLTEGTAAQPYAELGGALLGAGGATAGMRKFQELVAARAAAKLIPTSDEIKSASRALYQHPDVAAVQIHPDAVSNLAASISSDLKHGQNSGFRPANEPKVFSAVDELTTAAKENRPATVADIDSVRQVLGGLAKEKDAIGQPTRQAAAASRAIDQVNDFLPNLKQPDLLAGNAARANDILGEARANWAAFKKSSQVQNLAGNAALNAASSHSGANIQNATKQAFKPLLKNDGAKVASWTNEEKDALNSIVRGTWTGSAARAAGNVLGGGGGLGMLAGGAAGYEAGGLPGAIAGAAAGRAFKMIGNRSTGNAVDHLDTLIRSGSPEAMRIAAQNPQVVQALPQKSVQALRNMIFLNPALRALNQPSGTIRQPNAQ
jgi:hypothetical protein